MPPIQNPTNNTLDPQAVLVTEEELEAEVLGLDRDTDIAILQVSIDDLTGMRLDAGYFVPSPFLLTRAREMVGVRLDSGDFLSLSRQARRMLDEAGFPVTVARVVDRDAIIHNTETTTVAGAKAETVSCGMTWWSPC